MSHKYVINVFESANVGSIVALVQNSNPSSGPIHISDVKEENSTETIRLDIKRINRAFYKENQWSFDQGDIQGLKLKIEKRGIPFIKWKGVSINRGITTGLNSVFIISEKIENEILKRDPKSEEIILPVLKGSNIKRYHILKANHYLIYTYTGIEIEKYAGVYDYLKKRKKELEEVYEAKHGQKKWYELRKCSYYDKFFKPKLVWTRLSSHNAFAISENGEFTVDSSSFAISEDIILAITKDEDYLLNPTKQAQVKEYERQIDEMVFKLYGLTPEEIAIVEGKSNEMKY